MVLNEKLTSDYLAICELTKEIGAIVENSFNVGHTDLTPSDIEHILKITSNVTHKITSQLQELTV